MFWLLVPVLAYNNEGFLDHRFLILKHQDQFSRSSVFTLKTPRYQCHGKTLNNTALELSKFTKNGIVGQKGVPLNLPLLLMLYNKQLN